MIILGIIAALMLIALAYVRGEKTGDAAGYERGVFDGRQKARNDAAISAADVARRQREIAERVQKMEMPKFIDDMPAVPEVIAAKPVVPIAAARHSGKHKSRHR